MRALSPPRRRIDRLGGRLGRRAPPQITLALRRQAEAIHPQPDLAHLLRTEARVVMQERELGDRRDLGGAVLGGRRVSPPRLPQRDRPRIPLPRPASTL